MATIGGILLSIGAAYAATSFNNIMDALQLIFSLVNAPLFATFLLGMFWKRTTGHGAFTGLLAGTVAALLHHGLTLPADATPGIHGALDHLVHTYPSDMAQNFWTAIFAFTREPGGDGGGEPGDDAAAGERTGGAGVLADAEAGGGAPGVVAEAFDAGDRGAGDAGGVEPGVRLGYLTRRRMGLDIRIPLGLMFLITGGIMAGYGLFTRGGAMYERSLGVNLNLGWGAAMFVFGR